MASADPAATSDPEPASGSPAPGSAGGAADPGGNPASDAAPTPSADPDAEPPDPAEALTGGAATDDRSGGDGSGPAGGSALPIALGGGALVGVIGGLVLLARSRRWREDEPAPEPSVPEPAPDPEQLLAEALAAHGTRRASVGEAERLPLWVRRLDPEMPILPTLQNAPGEMDDPGERRTGRFIARPDAEPGETY
jgi:hypothetical protein